MFWINPKNIYTCILLAFITQVVFTQATCINKTAKEFENNCYELFTTKMNWTQAQKYCLNFNGVRSLAKVSSPSVLDFLKSLRPKDKDDGRVWLGASDQLQEGEWMWTDGTKANLTSMWGKDEPNNLGGNEHCLQIYKTYLNDDECHEDYSFICMEFHETTTTSKTNPTASVTSIATTAAFSFTTEENLSKTGNISGNTLDIITTSKTDPTTSVTSIATTATTSFTIEGNVSKIGNISMDHSNRIKDTTTVSKTDPTRSVTSMVTSATLSFTTEGNVSKTGNISMDHSNRIKDKMNSLGLAEWIGIGTGICDVVTLSVLAVVLVIKFRCKTVTEWDSGSGQRETKK